MNTPKVCVAVCNYNHSQYLKQSIESILTQSHQDLDVAVVDDGSRDQDVVRQIIDSLSDSRVRLIPLDKNKGKWNALNAAFSTTTAEVCTSHDADDVSLPWRISSQLKALVGTKTVHNLCGFVSCWSQEEMDSASKTAKEPTSTSVASGDDVTKAVLLGFDTPGINHYYTGKFETAGVSAMFLKRVWDIGFRFLPPGENLRVLMSEDSDFNFRVTSALRLTSLLMDTPYLYRRNTSTNKEER